MQIYLRVRVDATRKHADECEGDPVPGPELAAAVQQAVFDKLLELQDDDAHPKLGMMVDYAEVTATEFVPADPSLPEKK